MVTPSKLSPSSHEELSKFNKLFTSISHMQDDIKDVFASLGSSSKAVLAWVVLNLFAWLHDVSAQSPQTVIDQKKSTVIAKQKPLFVDPVTFLNQPATHNWAYTERQKWKTTQTSSQLSWWNATIENLLNRNKSVLPNDQIVLKESEMKKYLTDTISALVMRDVLVLVELSSTWYKDKSNINATTKDMEEFPMLGRMTLSIDPSTLILKDSSIVADKKQYNSVFKSLAKKHNVKKWSLQSLLAGFSIQKMWSKDFSSYKWYKFKQKELEKFVNDLYMLSLDENKKLSSNDIIKYMDVLTQDDMIDYVSNKAYTRNDFFAWLDVKKKLLPLLQIPDIAWSLDAVISDARKETLKTYREHLGSTDATVRNNAKTVFVVNLHKAIMTKIAPEIDKFLKHTKEKYTSQTLDK